MTVGAVPILAVGLPCLFRYTAIRPSPINSIHRMNESNLWGSCGAMMRKYQAALVHLNEIGGTPSPSCTALLSTRAPCFIHHSKSICKAIGALRFLMSSKKN